MENFTTWLQAHWPELAAFLGLGGGGVVAGKKWIDKRQDAEIQAIKAELSTVKKMAYENESAIQLVKRDLAENRKLDDMLRQEMKEDRNELREGINSLSAKIDKLFDYLLQKK